MSQHAGAGGGLPLNAPHSSLSLLFAELIDGPAAHAAYMLNGGDPGLLRSLDGLSAEQASKRSATGTASIAAHVDHVCYGLDMMNRWSDGEADPWSAADWSASWQRGTVTDSGSPRPEVLAAAGSLLAMAVVLVVWRIRRTH